MSTHNQGITVVEVLVGCAILLVVLLGVATALTQVIQARERINTELVEMYLAESGYEYVRFLRDEAWSNVDGLPTNTARFLEIATSSIAISATPEVIDGQFRRQFHLRTLYRDSNDAIVASTTSGAAPDDEGYEVWVEVGGPHGTTTFSGVLTNIFAE